MLFCLNEIKAEESLAESGFQVWRPTYLKTTHKASRVFLEPASLLSRYILAQLTDDNYHEALTHEHVGYVVGEISDQTLAELQAWTADGIFDEQLEEVPLKTKNRRKRKKGFGALMTHPLAQAA